MLFINPMWDSETERIGKQMCTSKGYSLHVLSDFTGCLSLLLLVALGGYLAFRGIAWTFHARLLWLLTIPFILAFIGSGIHHYSWVLARRRGFHYDADAGLASWIENG